MERLGDLFWTGVPIIGIYESGKGFDFDRALAGEEAGRPHVFWVEDPDMLVAVPGKNLPGSMIFAFLEHHVVGAELFFASLIDRHSIKDNRLFS